MLLYFQALFNFQEILTLLGATRQCIQKTRRKEKKIHLRIIDSSFKKVSDVMSAEKMFPQTKKSVAGRNGKVQWRVGHCQSHFKEAQLNSEVIFNLRQS